MAASIKNTIDNSALPTAQELFPDILNNYIKNRNAAQKNKRQRPEGSEAARAAQNKSPPATGAS
jgi:hypothetical protein